MTDDPKHPAPPPGRKLRRHEVRIEPPPHPGEPRRLVSGDHQVAWREPVPSSRPARRRETIA